MARTFEELGIDLSRARQADSGWYKTLCPNCSHDRKREHRNEKCLGANPAEGAWRCHNCGWKGVLDGRRDNWREANRNYAVPIVITATEVEAEAITYFRARGISLETLQRMGVVAEHGVIKFPYYLNGQHVNTKYRRLREKKMKMDAGARLTWWNIDAVRDARHIVIVEGEIDLLTLLEVGIDNVISLPNGAQTGAMSFFPDIDWDAVDRVTLAGDMDEPGEKCMQECAARIGKEKCWRVRWPENDANATLVEYGQQAVWDYFNLAQPIPIEGIEQPGDEEVRARVFAMYRDGLKPGLSTGYQHLDKGLTLITNILDIWGGYPGSGKSELLDGIVVNAGVMHEWRTAMYSPENYPAEYHIEKLARKYVGKPFKEGKTDRMTEDELEDALDWLNDHVHFIRPEQPTVEEVLKLAKIEKRRFGIHWLTLDPWNTMIHSLGGGESVTDYIGRQLSTVRQFLRQHDLRVSICAHPRKPMQGNGKIVPGPYEAAGSHNFYAMADSMLAVGRHKNDISKPVEVHIQKVRHRHLGSEGVCKMHWLPATGRYEDVDWSIGGIEL